jgi:hypothetical protein
VEETQDLTAFERSLSRRGFVKVMGKVGIGVVGAMVGVIGIANPVEAACGQMDCGATSPNWRCCSLNRPDKFCPLDIVGHPDLCSGYLYVWNCCCCGGSRTFSCAECVDYAAGDCCVTVAHTICSGGWTANPNTCASGVTSFPPPGQCP